jgi:predicted N-acetyltransferase YhbS
MSRVEFLAPILQAKSIHVSIEIREERPDDIAAVRDLNRRAFGQDQEGNIVDALRANGAGLLSLVALVNDQVVGHIMYSPVSVGGDVEGAALGPMAVLPECQRRGVGSKLIEAGEPETQGGGLPIYHCRGPRGLLSPIRIQTRQRTWNPVRMGCPG